MSTELENDKIVNFPENKIVKKVNLNGQKPKGFHQKRIEELVWQLEYEIMKGIEAKEFDREKEFVYQKILPLKRENGKFTIFQVSVFSTEFPF